MIIGSGNKYLDIETWPNKLASYAHRICRIDIADGSSAAFATGFLVGPDTVITAFHNIASLIDHGKAFDPMSVKLHFGYRYLTDGQIDSGSLYRLTQKDWLIDWSPVQGGRNQARSEALNYALLRVQGSPGLDAVAGMCAPPIRGWIEIPQKANLPRPSEPLLIMQHAEGGPLKASFESDAVIGVSEDETLVSYRVNTSPGSSGSPCLNIALELVALHEGTSSNLRANQGIAIHAILKALIAHGQQDLVSKKVPHEEPRPAPDDFQVNFHQSAPDPALAALIAGGETETVEFKEGACRNPRTGLKDDKMREQIIRAVVGFMNSSVGGTLIIGVADSGEVKGINSEYEIANPQRRNWDGYRLFLADLLDNNLSIENPLLLCTVGRQAFGEKDLCSVAVEPAHKAVYVNNRFYLRHSGQTKELSGPDLVDYVMRRWQD